MGFSIGIIAAVIAVLVTALAVTFRTAGNRKEQIKKLEESERALSVALVSTREELRRLGEFQAKKEEAQKNADEKKESLHTGDTASDFDNSIGLLHRAAGGGAPRP